MKKIRKIGLAIAFASLATLAVAVYALTASILLPTGGYISEVGVFSDEQCTTAITTIDWGTIEPGGTINKIVYVKNFGGEQLTVTVTPETWSPLKAANYMTFSWVGDSMVPGQAVKGYTFTLTVHENATGAEIGSFKFDLDITGTSA